MNWTTYRGYSYCDRCSCHISRKDIGKIASVFRHVERHFFRGSFTAATFIACRFRIAGILHRMLKWVN